MKFRAKYSLTILCLILSLNGLVIPLPVCNTASASAAIKIEDAVTNLIAQGEVIEAPANASAYISLKGIGHLVLASGARVKFASFSDGTEEIRFNQNPLLAASVISGDVIFKLNPRAGAFVQAGDSTLISAQGAYFHAGVHDGIGVFDASERVAMRLNNWAIRLPNPALDLGNWAITIPEDVTKETKSAPVRLGEIKRLHLDFKASTRPMGRVESLGAMTINTRLSGNSEMLWGNELIGSPEGMNAIATLDAIGQVTLVGGSQARLVATRVRGEKNRPVLTASLLNGTAIFNLEPNASAYVQAAGSKFVAARGSRFRVMIIEGRALIDNASRVVGEIGEWHLSGASIIPQIIPQVGQQPLQRQYLVRPVGLNSNLVVKARATRQIQVRVTDENDRPLNGVPIIFSLGSSGATGVGVLGAGAAASTSAKIFTDAGGIASVDFTAGTDAGSGSVSATVEGTTATWVGTISVLKVVPGFWSPQNALPVVATAAAAAAVGVAVTVGKDDNLPVRATGSTIIRP